MKKGESRKTYWVMYEERCKINIAAWNEPDDWQWTLRTQQHCGVQTLAEAEESVLYFQKHVDAKTHFLSGRPDGYYLTETWIEVEFRTRLVPNHPELVDAAFNSLAGANEANPAAENSQEA